MVINTAPTASGTLRRRSRRAVPPQRAVEASFRVRAREALRTEGRRMTKQRDALLDVIEHAAGHVDADAIYRLARERDARISLSTVYRTLTLLKQHRLVDELHLSEEHHHYEPASGPRHFHLVCSDCGQVEEFDGSALDGLRAQLKRERGFEVTSLQLDILGHCGHCPAAV